MATMIIRYRVRDYFDWHRVFTYSGRARKAYGIDKERIYRATNDGNNLIIVAEVVDVARATAFFASPLCQKIDEKADIIGRPEISFVDEEPVDMRPVEGASCFGRFPAPQTRPDDQAAT